MSERILPWDIEHRLEETIDRNVELQCQLDDCEAEVEDLKTERDFWKAACEQALRLWERAELYENEP